jgi:nicotinamidase-related amidase
MNRRKALLVIDMQKGSFTPKTPRFDTNGVVNRINELTSIFRVLNFSVFTFNMMEQVLESLKKTLPNGKF